MRPPLHRHGDFHTIGAMRIHPCACDARPMDSATSSENPASGRYKIRVRGRLSETLLAAFPDLSAAARGADTVLTAASLDQAALYGVLAQIERLGLELLEVRRRSP